MGLVDTSSTNRELIRHLRVVSGRGETLPENKVWQTFIELRKRGEPTATKLFLGAVRNLHSRRCVSGTMLPIDDGAVDEHKLADDSYLGDLWKAYKKCIRNQRTGPAGQLLRDLERHLEAN